MNTTISTPRLFAFGFLIGGVIGSATALLLAPQSGRRTRQQIQEQADEFTERMERVKTRATQIPARLQERAKVLAAHARNTVEESADRTITAIDRTEKSVSEALA